MKHPVSAILIAMIFNCLIILPIGTQDASYKLKAKGDKTALRDKSKPVRRALEVQYAKLAESIRNKDFAAFQALRTSDFSTRGLNGEPYSGEQMAARAKSMLEGIQHLIDISFTIGTINLRGDEAIATIHQRFSRMQYIEGVIRKVETSVTQDETWVNTQEGWKLKFVENERDLMWFVDGKRIEPGKPYDPDGQPYDPSTSPNRN
ncbi:MAG: nuclear transport factor 2 family protein [Blastocatellia bacterium]